MYPLYTSKPWAKSLWQEYRIYDDHLELGTLFFGRITVPFEQIQQVEVSEALLKQMLHGNLKNIGWAVKLDFADTTEHLVLDKSGGFFHHIHFTPRDPAEFKRILEETLTHFRARAGR